MFAKDIPRGATSYTVSLDQLRQGVTYEFRVVAVNEAGYGEPSSPSAAVSGRGPPGDCQHPSTRLSPPHQRERNGRGQPQALAILHNGQQGRGVESHAYQLGSSLPSSAHQGLGP